MFTHWYCEACKVESTEQHAKDADVSTVKNKIEWKHKYKAAACHRANELDAVRIGFPPQNRGEQP